ncbi:MAG: oxidoreductase [Planctomycetota bacterium]|nr:oxidoreductase [Planctomycetota bacterium]
MSFEFDTFLVREHVGFLKLHEAYDILSPDGTVVGTAVERASGFLQFLKLVVNKNMLPFTVEIMDADETVLLSIRRSFTFFRSKVRVFDEQNVEIGYFRQHIFSLGGGFDVLDTQEVKIATLKGDWKGWNFKFTDESGAEIGQVTKKWAGLAQELFTNADNYVVHIDRARITDVKQVQLMLAAALCIDMVLKEADG